MVCRFDSGYWSEKTIAILARLKVPCAMAVRCGNQAIAAVIATIEDDSFVEIDYSDFLCDHRLELADMAEDQGQKKGARVEGATMR